jgi:hypothetical protein
MQLHLENNELDALANILLEENHRPEILRTGDLLDRVLTRHLQFGFDELDYLLGLVASRRQGLATQLSEVPDGPRKTALQQQVLLLERVSDKLTEACAMV